MFKNIHIYEVEYLGEKYMVFIKTKIESYAFGDIEQTYFITKVYKGIKRVYNGWIPVWVAPNASNAIGQAMSEVTGSVEGFRYHELCR